MNLQEILEKDRERLTASLKQAGTPERAVGVIESEYDRLLYEYNEHCSDDFERRCAAMMLQTARMAAPLADCIGETAIWEQGGKLLTDEKKKVRVPAVILLVAGIVLSLASVIALFGIDLGNKVAYVKALQSIYQRVCGCYADKHQTKPHGKTGVSSKSAALTVGRQY
jgi:hypothetical protein